MLFFVWVMRPSFRVRGRPVKKTEAPQLFRELEELRDKLRVPGRMEVVLDDKFNAGAAESLGLFGLVGTRRVLMLGVPLLATLNRDELRAVLAHEFGHFSRRHGRFGQWLYRARIGWLKYAAYVSESDSPLESAAIRYAAWFVPYFSVRSFVHSRQCEYEADADGALAVGSKAFAAALTRTAVTAKFEEDAFPRQVEAWQQESPVPPRDFNARFAQAAHDAATTDLAALLEASLDGRSGWSDTHPTLSERLAALHEKPHLAAPGISAGESLLGNAWPAIREEFDAQWTRENGVEWALEHFKLKHRCPPAKALAELRALHESDPSDSEVAFAYAAALLEEDDAAGVTLMARLLQNSPLYRLPGHERLLAYYERRADAPQVQRCQELVKLAARRKQKALTDLLDAKDGGKVTPSSLAANIRHALRDAIALDSAVQKAWLVQGAAELQIAATGASAPAIAHVLVLTLDPQVLANGGEDEPMVRRRYAAALASLVAANEMPVVRTFFTTETVPAVFAASAALHPA
jgi:Zn-dependent protease with chaperone function